MLTLLVETCETFGVKHEEGIEVFEMLMFTAAFALMRRSSAFKTRSL